MRESAASAHRALISIFLVSILLTSFALVQRTAQAQAPERASAVEPVRRPPPPPPRPHPSNQTPRPVYASSLSRVSANRQLQRLIALVVALVVIGFLVFRFLRPAPKDRFSGDRPRASGYQSSRLETLHLSQASERPPETTAVRTAQATTSSVDSAVSYGGGWAPPDAEPETQSAPRQVSQVSDRRADLRPDDRFVFQGIVRDFDKHREQTDDNQSYTIWDFVVDGSDARGNPIPPIPVQMRSDDDEFEGFIRDGHKVGFFDEWEPGRVLRPKRVYNLTTDSMVEAVSKYGTRTKVIMICVAGASFLIFMTCGFVAVSTNSPIIGFLGFIPFLLTIFGLGIFKVVTKSKD
jgi:hypothetical protein